jgi:hypothetical protein
MKPGSLPPAEALHELVARMNPVAPVTLALEDAPSGSYLAGAPAGLLAPLPGRFAAVNGYGLPPGVRPGDEGLVRELVGPGGLLETGGVAGPGGVRADFECRRFESGALVPPDVDRVLPAGGAVLVAEGRIRIRDLPPRGAGIAGPRPGPAGPAGALRLDARLRAVLEARGIREVQVVPSFAAAFAIAGDEIVDARASPGPGERRDLVGPAIEEALLGLGLEPVPLGVIGDHPDAVRSAILHLRTRKVAVLVLSGGLGSGVNDRTLEGLARFELGFSLEGSALDGAPGIILAKTAGLDIVVLGGKPLEAAAGLDLFLGPALLARRGAPRVAWDWTLMPPLPLDEGSDPSAGVETRSDRALVRPASLVFGREGIRVRAWPAATPFEPLSAGQEGWALLEPGDLESRRSRYIPLGPRFLAPSR